MSTNILGEKIANLRKQHNLTQEQLADKLGITSQAVSKWETGITSPDISLLPSLAEIFSLSLDELFGVKQKAVMTQPNADTSKLLLRVRVLSASGDKVNINLPYPIISKALEMNLDMINIALTAGNNALKEIDWRQLLEAVDMGLRGKVVDIQSADGDIVEIVIE